MPGYVAAPHCLLVFLAYYPVSGMQESMPAEKLKGLLLAPHLLKGYKDGDFQNPH